MNSLIKRGLFSIIGVILSLPVVVSAGSHTPDTELGYFGDLATEIGALVDTAQPVVVGLAILAFFFGLAKYIFQAGDEEAQDEAKQIMIAGVVGLFFIAAIGGIIDLLATSFGIDQGENITPTPTGTGGS